MKWLALAAATAGLLLVPVLFGDRFVFVFIQMLTASLFALAFNLLWRHTRLLSFGHAAYFGAGMFATIHLMRLAEANALVVPLPLVPLGGALAACLLGVVAGYFATVRTGTYFAMITLAVAELIYALGSQWEALFGGEAGLSSMRLPWAGWTFATTGEVYYIVLGWVVPAAASLYFVGLTPLGRLGFAIGDDETRVRFLGYNAHLAKTMVFALSAFHAGLAGGLLALVNENVNYGAFGGTVSASVVLHTFIGGSGVFLGPVIGAAGLTVLGALLSDVTRLWLLYVGAAFVLMMLYSPEGLAALFAANLRLWRELPWPSLARLYVLGGLAVLAFVCTIVFVVELAARAMAEGASSASIALVGTTWSLSSPVTWAAPIALALAGHIALKAAIRQRRRLEEVAA
jgi:branched-chain amino acid transport system permease protein